jgi:F420-dependent oxidoreductase-like protein
VQIHGQAIRFGLHSGQQYAAFTDCLALWRRAEDLGYDWVSIFDHFRPPLGGPDGPCFEGTTALAALAASTNRVRCGLLVAAVTWRHPALLAAVAATLDHVSGGRLEFGIGAAGPDLGYAQYGIPFPADRSRLDMLDEACHVLRSLWTLPSTTFDGQHYQLTDARLEPKPLQARLPLIVGGEGERRMLRIVAEHADIWNTLAADPVTYHRKLDALARHCADVGRDPAQIRKSVTFRAVLAATDEQARRRADEVFLAVPRDSPDRAEYLVTGTPDQCTGRLLEYAALGVSDFLLAVRPPLDYLTVELFARHVVPAVRAALSR